MLQYHVETPEELTGLLQEYCYKLLLITKLKIFFNNYYKKQSWMQKYKTYSLDFKLN